MKKIILNLIFLFLLLEMVSGLNVEIDVKDSFSFNEMMEFEYTLTSDSAELIRYIPYIQCLDAPLKLVGEEIVELQPSIPYIATYSDQIIDESIEPQTCTVHVEILEPIQERFEENFEIKTNPSFDFDLKLNKKIFVKNEDINLDFDSKFLDVEVETLLIYPSGRIKEINLPYSFKADRIGTYELEIVVSKEGYKTQIINEEFGVIKAHVEVKDLDFNEIEEEKSNKLFWILGLGVIIVIGYWLYRRLKHKPVENLK